MSSHRVYRAWPSTYPAAASTAVAIGISAGGAGGVQPDVPCRHRHVDVAYVDLSGTFYCVWTSLDG